MKVKDKKLASMLAPKANRDLEATMEVVRTVGSQGVSMTPKELLTEMRAHDRKVLADASSNVLGMALLYAKELLESPDSDPKLKHDAAMRLLGHAMPSFAEINGGQNANGLMLQINLGAPAEERREVIDV